MSIVRRLARRLVVLLLVSVVTLLAVLIVVTTPRLDVIQHPDVVVVLGGGGGERLAFGQQVAAVHRVPVFAFAEGVTSGVLGGVPCDSKAQWCVEPNPSTTAGEARTAAAYAKDNGWQTMAVATSTFHVNRARVLFRQCFEGEVLVTGIADSAPLEVQLRRAGREALGIIAAYTLRRAC
ncbi:MAG: ElyC/SanA/YdcF family protein [Nitriliruptoraceae bacterium]